MFLSLDLLEFIWCICNWSLVQIYGSLALFYLFLCVSVCHLFPAVIYHQNRTWYLSLFSFLVFKDEKQYLLFSDCSRWHRPSIQGPVVTAMGRWRLGSRGMARDGGEHEGQGHWGRAPFPCRPMAGSQQRWQRRVQRTHGGHRDKRCCAKWVQRKRGKWSPYLILTCFICPKKRMYYMAV